MLGGAIRGALLAATFSVSLNPASARVTPLDTFGGLVGAARAQAAPEAWGRLPDTDRSCLERALTRRTADLAGLIRQGIGPDDGRLLGLFAECRRFTAAPTPFAERHPRLARHHLAPRDDRRELMAVATQILDDGTARYEDRPLETPPVTARIRMRDPIEGECPDVGYVAGHLNDAQSGVTRGAFGETCDEVGPRLARDKRGERFSSRWIAP